MIIDWLQAGEQPGIAVSGCRLPAPGGLRKVLGTGLDADLVVFTPRACLVIDIEMPTAPMTGDMQCPAAEPWRMAGISGDPIEVRLRDTNPLDRLTETIEAVGAVLGGEDSPVEVLGLLVVVPFAGVPITMNLDREGLPAGTDVLLAEDPHQLYERLAAVEQVRSVVWTAERVRGALDVLVGEQHGLTGEQLVAMGFPGAGTNSGAPSGVVLTRNTDTAPAGPAPGQVPAAAGPPPGTAAVPGAAPAPGTAGPPPVGAVPASGTGGPPPVGAVPASRTAVPTPLGTAAAPPDTSVPGMPPHPAPTASAVGTGPAPSVATAAEPPPNTHAGPAFAPHSPSPDGTPQAPSPADPPPPSPGSPLHSVARKRTPLTSILLAILALIAFGTGLWLFSQCAAADDAAPRESTPLPVQTVADRPEPVPAPAPAPQTPTCYPFQPGC
ncbi:hypothetical protein [Nocardia asteroides]|uniref:hypothetical protein n=1 Tax=Nocardia asteroides TaxID=1824 RepID=UPI001E33A416|nr:hypothetical protein [Nocardia asteroides]UGT63059.1 hypothetical protein LTT61_06950 [Nocardia asteroides]